MADKSGKSSGSSGLILQLIVTIGLAWLAFSYAGRDRSAAPCGAYLPEVPRILTNTGDDMENISVMEGRIPANFLQFMAPQPDGAMPLRYPLEVFRSDFRMMLPMGTTSLPMGDTFEEDAIDSQVVFQYDQALDFIKISLPMRRDAESVTEFVSRARHDYEQLDAKFYPDTSELAIGEMLFQHFEYQRPTKYSEAAAEHDVSHFIYFAPAGVRVLIIDFITTPERHEAARPLVEKIMRSIEPGGRFLEQMRIEYPARFPLDEPDADAPQAS